MSTMNGTMSSVRGILVNSATSSLAGSIKDPNKKPSFNLDAVTIIERWPQRKLRLVTLHRPPAESYGFYLRKQPGYAHISKVDDNSPSQHEGIDAGDVVVGVNGNLLQPDTAHDDVVKLVLQNASLVELLLADEATFRYFTDNNFRFSYDYAEPPSQYISQRPSANDSVIFSAPPPSPMRSKPNLVLPHEDTTMHVEFSESQMRTFERVEELNSRLYVRSFDLFLETSTISATEKRIHSANEHFSGYDWSLTLSRTGPNEKLVRFEISGIRASGRADASSVDRFVPVIRVTAFNVTPRSSPTASESFHTLAVCNENKSKIFAKNRNRQVLYTFRIDANRLRNYVDLDGCLTLGIRFELFFL